MNPLNKHRLILRFVTWYFLINSLIFCLLGHSYLHAILSSGTLFKNPQVDYTDFFGQVFIMCFAILNFLSYMMLLAFIPAVCILCIAFLLPSKRLIWCISALSVVIEVILIVADSRIYAMFKFHLSPAILTLIFSKNWKEVFDFSQYEIISFGIIISLISGIEILLAYFVWHKIVLHERFKVAKYILFSWSGAALFSYFTLVLSINNYINLFSQQTPNLPMYNQILAYVIPDKNAQDILIRYSENLFSEPMFSNDKLNYPLHAMHCQAPLKPYNLIFIMVDSLRFDMLKPDLMPNVLRFATNNWQFLKHYSGGNSTQSGLFSLFYSIPSSYWTAALVQQKPPVLIELLLQYDYNVSAIWSSEMQNPPFDKTIFLQLKDQDLEVAESDDIGDSDKFVTARAIKYLHNKSTSPFFLHLFYNAPHGYCDYQSFPHYLQPATGRCSRIAMTNSIDPAPYYNRYLNAVHFVDNEIGKVLEAITQEGYLDNSIVIFTSDHGQEFNDTHQNYWEHASNFSDFQTMVPLIIHWPHTKPQRFTYLTTSYDLVPTLLKRLCTCTNPTSDYSIGQDILKPDDRRSFVLAGGYVNMGIIEPKRLTTLQASGLISITDTLAAPMDNGKVHMTQLKEALILMRKYYAKKATIAHD